MILLKLLQIFTRTNLKALDSKPETNTYGGVYFWEISKKTWKTMLNLKCLKKLPTTLLSQTQLSIQVDYSYLEGPTRTTRGIT